MECPLVTDGHKIGLGLKVAALCVQDYLDKCLVRVLSAHLVLSQTPPQGSEAHLSAEIPENHRPNSFSTWLLAFIALSE